MSRKGNNRRVYEVFRVWRITCEIVADSQLEALLYARDLGDSDGSLQKMAPTGAANHEYGWSIKATTKQPISLYGEPSQDITEQ